MYTRIASGVQPRVLSDSQMKYMSQLIKSSFKAFSGCKSPTTFHVEVGIDLNPRSETVSVTWPKKTMRLNRHVAVGRGKGYSDLLLEMTIGLFGAFPTQVRGHHKVDPWALRFLVLREIECGDWLARGYMPAHQHCDLFCPLVGDLIGSAVTR